MQSFFFWRSFSLKFFSGKFGEIWAKSLLTPQNLPAPTPMTTRITQPQVTNPEHSPNSVSHVLCLLYGAFHCGSASIVPSSPSRLQILVALLARWSRMRKPQWIVADLQAVAKLWPISPHFLVGHNRKRHNY